ncbi:hypothetical protein [Sphingobium sp. DC-2]|uniref:DUF6925 family protein n=1 Tax=Sphingobium sp. DC-2 TaxID=1303256 RepID=UPI0004C44E7A|nr:hypothetical protein [Sphingobium sp. DC-2]
MSLPQDPFDLIAAFLDDPAHGWSIGSFGAIGEFIRDPEEQVEMTRAPDRLEACTARGAIRIERGAALTPIAWDSLSPDGESWGHSLAFCVPRETSGPRVIGDMGIDEEAIRATDRGDRLFDLGVGSGVVTMCLRTKDAGLIAAMEAAQGQSVLGNGAVMGQVLRAQPHRVQLSPAGRVEVFQPIPPPDGKSPDGPHTHLLPKLIAKDRGHSANVPIPEGWQSALNVHPASPWRTSLGERKPFDAALDRAFAPYLEQFGLDDDHRTARMVHAAIEANAAPEFADWPASRRGRIKARIELRRRAVQGDRRVVPWRVLYDRAEAELEGEEDA